MMEVMGHVPEKHLLDEAAILRWERSVAIPFVKIVQMRTAQVSAK